MRFNVLGQIVTALGRIIAAGALKDRTFRCEAALEATMATETLAGLVGLAALIACMLIPGEYEICKKLLFGPREGNTHMKTERERERKKERTAHNNTNVNEAVGECICVCVCVGGGIVLMNLNVTYRMMLSFEYLMNEF